MTPTSSQKPNLLRMQLALLGCILHVALCLQEDTAQLSSDQKLGTSCFNTKNVTCLYDVPLHTWEQDDTQELTNFLIHVCPRWQ